MATLFADETKHGVEEICCKVNEAILAEFSVHMP